ncbi:MAG: AI-2E family transporter [Saprospiraceae bacterium]|nr:AI-2E family transporter [Saprospiraceae bacterium]
MNKIPAPFIRQILLLLLIALIFSVLFWNLQFFIPAVLGAYTLYILTRSPLFYLIERRGWNKTLATVVLMALSFLIIMLPMFWVFKMLEGHVLNLLNNSDSLFANAQRVIGAIEAKYGVEIMTPDNVRSLTGQGVHLAQSILNATLNGLLLVIATYFILWFMMQQGKDMEQAFLELLPLREENVRYVRQHLRDMVWSNALGIPLMGVVQAFVALPVYWLAGVDNVWLWFAITFVAGMMPVVGVAMAYIPLSLMLLANGMESKAMLIFLYGLIVVGSVDNIARMWVLKKIGNAHPLVTLFGVVVGLKLFGFIGFIFGPILISMAILLFRIYHKEFGSVSGHHSSE